MPTAVIAFVAGAVVAVALLWPRRHRADATAAADAVREQADERIIEISRLSGGLAHEIRNPLSTLMMNLRLLEEDLGDALAEDTDALRRARLKIGVVRAESERLQRMLDEFLLVVGPVRLRTTRVDLNDVVDRLVDFYAPEARRQGITLRAQTPDQPLWCRADPDVLQQAVLNLLINAQQAITGAGEIILTADREDDRLRLDVADTGSGMTPEVADRALQAFYSTKPNGSGLGLSTTARIVSAHGGELTLDSTPGVGSCFTIRLPAGVPPTPA